MGRLIAIDTDVLIYFYEDRKRLGDSAEKILRAIETGEVHGLFSSVGITELLTLPLREGRQDIVDYYRDDLYNFPHLRIVTVDAVIAEEAAKLRAMYNLKTPDALHLATAIITGAELFVTNDKALKRVKEIKIQLLSDVH